ncbi:hypothetical protein I6U51_23410 [Clostridium aciditolerans]|uniref:Uncharacterized protein n=2 Tax=Clostridium aciditolerans TaxID=339861 RepID=A0A934M601_9CLOT|nr:hypothetical protein [Clostridium aciditolerans]
MNYYNDNNEDIIENYYQPRNMNSPTYPMYSCPPCNYPMSMRDEYYNSDEYDDPGYRQRRRRRRRYHRPFFYPFYPFYPYYDPYFNYGFSAPFLAGLLLGSFL